MFRALPYLFLLLLLSGCASCTQDPSQAGFFCGVQNISSGTYERRQQVLQSQAAQAQEQAAQQAQQASTLQREEQADVTERNTLRAQLTSIQADVNRQRRELARARTERGANQVTIAKLETQQRQLQDRLNYLKSHSVSSEEIAQLKRENAELQRKMNEVVQRKLSE